MDTQSIIMLTRRPVGSQYQNQAGQRARAVVGHLWRHLVMCYLEYKTVFTTVMGGVASRHAALEDNHSQTHNTGSPDIELTAIGPLDG